MLEEQDNDGKVFSEDYVKNLRQEAAGYRTQVKELKSALEDYKNLEGTITSMKVENELIRRGITAEADWVKVSEGSDISKAVDEFIEKYPHLSGGASGEVIPQPNPAAVPPPLTKGGSATGNIDKVFGARTLEEIESDPEARKAVSRFYRQHLPNAPLED